MTVLVPAPTKNGKLQIINKPELNGLLEFINVRLGKIKSFSNFSITANADSDARNLLAGIAWAGVEDARRFPGILASIPVLDELGKRCFDCQAN
jgi:hypothetical protein